MESPEARQAREQAENEQLQLLKAKKKAEAEKKRIQSEKQAERACARQRAREQEKLEAAEIEYKKTMKSKANYLILTPTIFQQCTNLKVPWRGGHNIGRETFSVKDLEVGAGAMYTGEIMCTHRSGPNRTEEYECKRVHWLNGEGTLRLATGEVYEGTWRQNKFSGRGNAEFPDNSSFQGSFVHKAGSPPVSPVKQTSPSSSKLPSALSPTTQRPVTAALPSPPSISPKNSPEPRPQTSDPALPEHQAARRRARRRSITYIEERIVEPMAPTGTSDLIEGDNYQKVEARTRARRKSMSLDKDEAKKGWPSKKVDQPWKRPIADIDVTKKIQQKAPKSPSPPCSPVHGGPMLTFGTWLPDTGKAVDYHLGHSNTYTGDFVKGKPHGEGTCKYRNGDQYSGQWQEGCWHGTGVYTYRDGSKIEGPFEANLPVRCDTAPPLRDGTEFRSRPLLEDTLPRSPVANSPTRGPPSERVFATNFPLDGDATFTFDNGGVFDGSWRDGKAVDGSCTKMMQGTIEYTGPLVSMQRHGRGTGKFPKGEVYDGEWVGGNRHGQGSVEYANGGKFVGEWKNNLPWDGKMEQCVDSSGNCYTGTIKNGKYDGDGVLWYSYGSAFTGQFREGKTLAGKLEQRAKFKNKMAP